MKKQLLVACLLLGLVGDAVQAGENGHLWEVGRIYTKTKDSDGGGIEGKLDGPVTHAFALDQTRNLCFLAKLTDSGKAFSFLHIPVGKYDLVMVNKKKWTIFEGLDLGEKIDSMPADSKKNFESIVSKQDGFFNRYNISRAGLKGEKLYALIERLRDKIYLTQGGDVVPDHMRRMEVMELDQAKDDWQVADARHIYHEGEPKEATPPKWMKDVYVAEFNKIRVVDSVKNIGTVALPKAEK